jgi:hypothetical protein
MSSTTELNHMEIWKPIDGFPRYEVSSTGSVRSLPQDDRNPPFVLKLKTHKNGYAEVALYAGNGSRAKYKLVHRLVAAAFLTPAPRRPTVNHKDGNKRNNITANLEWMTMRQNNAHANARGVRHALTNPRRAHKLTAEIVAQIRATVPRGRGAKTAAARFGISPTMLQKILSNRAWIMPKIPL